MRADTRLPPYLPYPRFLLQADLTQTAKLLYALLLDRATLSQANGWLDEGGRIYLVFPIEKIAAALDRSPMTVKTALSELEDAGLIERRRSGFSKPNRIYVKLPPEGQKSFQMTDGNPPSIEKENCPTDGQKVVPIGYLLWGSVGTGKSFFAACIANALMEKEIPVRMTNFAAVLNDLSGSYEGRNAYIARLCRYPLLILDDFGMERGTEYGLEQVYNVIDSRYRSGKPLIVTTNLSLDELQHPQDTPHARIYDRLLEMCAPILFTGTNFRRQTAQNKLDRLKTMMKEKECL